MTATISNPAIIDPELKGNPILFTKNISKALKKRKIFGASNLNINNNIAYHYVGNNEIFDCYRFIILKEINKSNSRNG